MNFLNRPLFIFLSVTALLAGCNSLDIKKSDQAKASAENSIDLVNKKPESAQIVVAEHQFDTVWDRIRSGYGLPLASNSAIDTQIRFYTSNKSYFYRVTQQSEPYLHFVVSEMQANNMPLELALLPYMESSYNPVAASASNLGMWQIGSATARNLGLKQNTWYDGRKDVVESTGAAIRLLKKLYAKFDNNWLLAVAAYNAGDGTIQQAIEKNRRAGKPTDFWSLPLNKTTQGYIPQLLALSKIVADPNVYNFKLYPIPDVPYFVKVNVGSQINLAEAAKNSSLDSGLLKKLNAGFNGWLTDPTQPRDVLVPVDSAASFRLQLDSSPKLASVKWQEYVVKKGDKLDIIAKRYGISATKIQTINNLNGINLTAGQRLQIPLPEQNQIASTTEKVVVNQTPKKEISNTYYTVKAGENLWSISKTQNMSVDALAQLNKITSKSVLKPGQQLVVLSQSTELKNTRTANYTVKSGDTLGKIANQYDISVKQIMDWNKITDETNIRPDQLIVLADPKN